MARLAIDVTLRDAFALLRRDWSLTLSIAAIFCFLPSFIYFGFVPFSAGPDVADTAEADYVASLLMAGIAVPMLVLGTFNFIGMLMIIRIWFQPTGGYVLDALRYGVGLLPVAVAIHLLVSSASLLGMMLLLLPGFYIIARTLLILPALADAQQANPLAAWREGWTLAKGNVVPLLLLAIMMGMLTLAVAVALALIDGSFADDGPVTPTLLIGLSNGLTAVISGMLNAAIAAAAYRHLRIPGAREIFS
ncbi:MAG: hypothetical protein H2056_07940 [Sphingopyxis sp.]|nr:hypothetical protein [Sphingopyxis sp.]